MLPPWPGWDGLHPIVVHFPIALSLIAPLFVAMAVVRPARAACLGFAALVLLVIGTAGSFVAVGSGEAAAELATRSEAINAAIEAHATLAEQARMVLAVLTLLYGATVIVPLYVKKLATPTFARVANLVMLVLLLGGALLMANVGHRGGLLVHKYGVQAMITQ
jgi:uncharacterized membrane protein